MVIFPSLGHVLRSSSPLARLNSFGRIIAHGNSSRDCQLPSPSSRLAAREPESEPRVRQLEFRPGPSAKTDISADIAVAALLAQPPSLYRS
jgi:hypothetical protein